MFNYFPPVLPLVGIEPNPGPPKNQKGSKNPKKNNKNQKNQKQKQNKSKKSSSSSLSSLIKKGAGSILSEVVEQIPIVGSGAKNLVNKIFGSGDYEVKENALMDSINGPAMFADSKDSITIGRKTYIGPLISGPTSAFHLGLSFRINPGAPEMDPILADLALTSEEYELLGMLVYFESTSAVSISNGTNLNLGKVIIATQYNPLDAPFTDSFTAENFEFSTRCKPSESMMHPVECAREASILSKLYIRNPSSASPDGTGCVPFSGPTFSQINSDRRFYDFANVSVMTEGIPGANQTIGEVWVAGLYRLRKFRLSIPLGITSCCQNQGNGFAGVINSINGPSRALTGDVLFSGTYSGSGTSPIAVNIPTLPAGTEIIFSYIASTSAAVTGIGATSVTNQTNLVGRNVFSINGTANNTPIFQCSNGGGTLLVLYLAYTVLATGPSSFNVAPFSSAVALTGTSNVTIRLDYYRGMSTTSPDM